MKVGLFFGSFNPIHTGHMAIAQYMLEHTALEKIWFVVSPQNPFKTKETLLDQQHRLTIVRIACSKIVFLIIDLMGNLRKNANFSRVGPKFTNTLFPTNLNSQ